MKITSLLAKHLREVHFGGNWTWVNLKDTLANVNWQQATMQINSLNTIVKLTYHIHYYVTVVSKVLQGEPLTGKDKFSFDHPPINSEEDWQNLLNKVFTDAENFAKMVEALPDSKLEETFMEEKYGNYYRNLQGIIEHTHYHLGQIVIIKKLLQAEGEGESQ